MGDLATGNAAARIHDSSETRILGKADQLTSEHSNLLTAMLDMRATLRCAKCSNAARGCYPVACVAGFAFGAAAFLLCCFCCDAGVCSHVKFRAFTFRLSMCRSGTYMSRGRAIGFGFAVIEAAAAVLPKALPVILRTTEEIDTWLSAPVDQVPAMQRPSPDGTLRVVARGKDQDGEAE